MYGRFLSRLSKQRRADAENKSVTPTLPLPLLNKPSPYIKEVKPSVENQNQNLLDSKTQNIAQKMFPGNKPNVAKTEPSKVTLSAIIWNKHIVIYFILDIVIETFKEKESNESVIQIPVTGNNINNLDDFVPDDELDKSFLDDAGHGDIIVRGSKDVELDSDER